jgi:hypothetical protein
LLDDINREEWASRIEPYLRTGFMITPNNSRLLDKGWGGTSAPDSSPDDPRFIKIKKSFVENYDNLHGSYQLEDVEHGWRWDAINYRARHNRYFYLRDFEIARTIYRLWKILKLPNLKKRIHKNLSI